MSVYYSFKRKFGYLLYRFGQCTYTFLKPGIEKQRALRGYHQRCVHIVIYQYLINIRIQLFGHCFMSGILSETHRRHQCQKE